MNEMSSWHYMTQKVYGYFTTSCLSAACHFKIADIIGCDVVGIRDLAEVTKTHPFALYRLMRFLSAQDIFEEHPKQHFKNNANSDLLKVNHPQSIHSFSLFHSLDLSWKSWLNLKYSIKTGSSATENVYGIQAFEVMKNDEQTLGVFDNAMSNLALADASVIHDHYEFSECQVIADIGGGNGAFLKEILRRHPEKKGVVFDQDHVILTNKQKRPFSNITFISGDFLTSVPVKADLYIARHIIHDWDDAYSLKIIRNIKSHMTPKSKLLIIELLMDNHSKPSLAKYRDMNMLVTMNGGYERTLEEYINLFEAASLYLKRIVTLPTEMNLLEFSC